MSKLASLIPKSHRGRVLAGILVPAAVIVVIVGIVTAIVIPPNQQSEINKIYQAVLAGRALPQCLTRDLPSDAALSTAAATALKPYVSAGKPHIRSVQSGRLSVPTNPPYYTGKVVYNQVYVQFGGNSQAPWVEIVLGPGGRLCGVGDHGLVPAGKVIQNDDSGDGM